MITRADADLIAKVLADFLTSREGARRFHAQGVGDVDPHYCLGDFLHRVRTNDEASLEKVYGATRTKAAMGEGSGVVGGYLLPRPLSDALYGFVEEAAIVRPSALVAPMTTQTLDLPLPDLTTAQSAGVPPYFGGLNLTWTAEADARSESEPAWKSVALRAWDLSGVVYASNNFLQDASAGTEKFLYRLFGRSCAWHEDYAFLVGDGVGKPQGMKNSPCAVNVTRASGSDFTAVDAGKMLAALPPSSWERAFWAAHPTVYAKLTGQSGWQANQPDDARRVSAFYHGLPLYVTDKVPALGTAGDVMLLDCGLYVVGDRRAAEVAFSPHEPGAFVKNQGVFRIVHRVDGRGRLQAPVKAASDGTTSLSPFVILN